MAWPRVRLVRRTIANRHPGGDRYGAGNPGADLYREPLYIIDSGDSAARMRDVSEKMAHLAVKLMRHEPIGFPAEEGYIARGLIRDQFVEKSAAERLSKGAR